MPASEPSSDLDQTIGRAFLSEPGDGAPAVLPGARILTGPFDPKADLGAIRSNALERLHPSETPKPSRRAARISLAGAGLLHAAALTALLGLEQPPPPAEGGTEIPVEIIVEAQPRPASAPVTALAPQPVSAEPATAPPDAPAPATPVIADIAPAPSAALAPASLAPAAVAPPALAPENPPPPVAPSIAAEAELPPAAAPSVPAPAKTEIAAPLPPPMESAAVEPTPMAPMAVAPSPPPLQAMPAPQVQQQTPPNRTVRPKSSPTSQAERDLKAARDKLLKAEREAAKARAEARRQAIARDTEAHDTAAPAESSASAESIAAYGRSILSRISAMKAYPESARSRNAQGTAVVRFNISGGGAVTSASIAQSSGDSGLDADALATVRRAGPFGAPPPGAPRTIAAPLHYHMP